MERLDGNAIAGMLSELFVPEMTVARCRCGVCGRIEPLGAGHVYAHPLAPGVVLRCCHCENALLVVVRGGGRWRIAAVGMTWVEVAEAAPAALARDGLTG
jgi:hypothetical protein